MAKPTEKIKLDDRKLKALKPAPKGKRYEVMDALVPGFGVRVYDKEDVNRPCKAARRTFFLYTRFPGSQNPTRRALGVYDALSLADARDKAKDWLVMIGRGIDPADEKRQRKAEEEEKRRAEEELKEQTFAAIVEIYITRKIRKQRRAIISEREIRRNLIPVLGHMLITEIASRDVVSLIEAIADRPATSEAHNAFGHLRAFYNWAINRDLYGLETSPCDRLKPKDLIGEKNPREHTLKDKELAAFWRAATRLGYPFGPIFQMLALTGQRKSDVSDARWREFDLPNRRWVIPAKRFKSGKKHIVPLSDAAVEILDGLPHFAKGDHLFSTTSGEKPVSGFSKAKRRLDTEMLLELEEMEPFVIHDIRRTMRTGLASLRVQDHVAEMVIGHGRKGLQRIYDQHSYEPEMREALDAWAARLRGIVSPPPENVVKLPVRA